MALSKEPKDLKWSSKVSLVKRIEDFQNSNTRPAILVIYSPDCGYSEQAQKKINAILEAPDTILTHHVFRYNAVPSDAEEERAHDAFNKAFQGIRIKYYPLILGFSNNKTYKGQNAFEILEFTGDITKTNLERFYNEQLR
jgi:hypothetical protein